jgi:CRISPR-associated endonuclease/helicase Cas3
MNYSAHSLEGRPECDWQPLDQHLEHVGRLAGEFASAFGADEFGRIAGSWHDLGKYSKEFQYYLRRKNGFEAHIEGAPGRVDHSSAGAQHSAHELSILGHLIAYVIAGHHSGLLDGRSPAACQEDRLKKQIPVWEAAPAAILHVPLPPVPQFIAKAFGEKNAFSIAFFTRMIFSCLVDADFLDTEKFMDPKKHRFRLPLPADILSQMESALDQYVLGLKDDHSPVNQDRQSVRAECLIAAGKLPGFFSLTVPTGCGKTLSSLGFALRHALLHGLKRIVYVLPFTTIIEQNADEFRNVMNLLPGIPLDRLVVEHHSNIDPENETPGSRLGSENWDAPLIVTTCVQFYESLFANRTSACRKLHNLSNSVIILDEAQTLPIDFLQPCLRALTELVQNYRATVVLCTATQPAIRKTKEFLIGISGIREIISNPTGLYHRLKRVELKNLGALKDNELLGRIRGEHQVLIVVNTRAHARKLWKDLDETAGHYHLSAQMCPAHRASVLGEIRTALKEGRTCRVISTQLIEAGVDIDFPVVYRSMAGIDSIAQAAGRCNRNGRLPRLGRVYIFGSEWPDEERFLIDTANCTAQVLDLAKGDPLALQNIERYFRLYYWDQSDRWDSRDILGSFSLVQDRGFPFLMNYSTVSDKVKIIAEDMKPVIVPWQEQGTDLWARIRNAPYLSLGMRRRLQRFIVQVRSRTWYGQLGRSISSVFDGSCGVLISVNTNYSDRYGLHFDDENKDIWMA